MRSDTSFHLNIPVSAAKDTQVYLQWERNKYRHPPTHSKLGTSSVVVVIFYFSSQDAQANLPSRSAYIHNLKTIDRCLLIGHFLVKATQKSLTFFLPFEVRPAAVDFMVAQKDEEEH